MARKFCQACGERKRLTWPKYDQAYCKMSCAAIHHAIHCGDGVWEGEMCGDCGDIRCNCDCPREGLYELGG